jgi:hypothetical protein
MENLSRRNSGRRTMRAVILGGIGEPRPRFTQVGHGLSRRFRRESVEYALIERSQDFIYRHN